MIKERRLDRRAFFILRAETN